MYTNSHISRKSWSPMKQSKVAVIGAGFAGVTCAKNLIQDGHDVTVFEKHDGPGGVWKYKEHGGGVWKSAFATSSKWVTMFSDFPMPDDYPDYPDHNQMLKYLMSYAEKFGVDKRIRYGEDVRKVAPNGNGWIVETLQGEEEFDAVAICTGIHQQEAIPQFPGFETFSGTSSHSNSYKEPSQYAGKRVLVVGTGESAQDIATEVAAVAEKVVVSSRHGVGMLPRYFDNLPIDSFFPRWKFWLPGWLVDAVDSYRYRGAYGSKYGHPIKEWALEGKNNPIRSYFVKSYFTLERIKEGKVIPKRGILKFSGDMVYFQDGSAETVDMVIFCTGYRLVLPFLPEGFRYVPEELFKTVFLPNYPNIGFIGLIRPNFGAMPPMAEMQSRLFSAVAGGSLMLPDAKTMGEVAMRDTFNRRKWQRFASDRLRHIHDYPSFLYHMGSITGCTPQLWKYIHRPRLFCALLMNTMPVMFRLQGPHPWDGASVALVTVFNRFLVSREYRRFQIMVGALWMGLGLAALAGLIVPYMFLRKKARTSSAAGKRN